MKKTRPMELPTVLVSPSCVPQFIFIVEFSIAFTAIADDNWIGFFVFIKDSFFK